MTQAEHELLRLIGWPNPLGPDSTVQRLILLSATHMTTFVWLKATGLAARGHVVPVDQLRDDGFTLPEHLVAWRGAGGKAMCIQRHLGGAEDIWESTEVQKAVRCDNRTTGHCCINACCVVLGPDDWVVQRACTDGVHSTQAIQHILYTQGAATMVLTLVCCRQFAVDISKPKRMRMVALTQRVDAAGFNMKQLALRLFQCCKEALTDQFGGSRRLDLQAHLPVVMVVSGYGVAVAGKEGTIRQWQDVPIGAHVLRERHPDKPNKKTRRRRMVREAMEWLESDERYNGRPLVVVGYSMFKRSTSMYVPQRCITHMIVALADAKTSADVSQALMRAGGQTVQARMDAGYADGNVRVLTYEEDLALPGHLQAVTAKVGIRTAWSQYLG
jgi:hypothetical protein